MYLKLKAMVIGASILCCTLISIYIAGIEPVNAAEETTVPTETEIQYVPAETQMCTPTPTSTPIPTPTNTPTPTPTPMPETPEEWYDLALKQGEVEPASDDHLTAYDGVYYGPSGRETYYNLKMDLVVAYMRDLGYDEEDYPYWIREDGCKMLGNYIMVAANWSIRPKGTILETSLGTAIVVDTGSFVSDYPEGIDIAVNW